MGQRNTGDCNRSGRAGFTLIELLVGILITSILLAAFAGFNRFQLLTMMNQTRQLGLQSRVRSFVDLFTGEVRRACGIVAASPKELHFRADLNGDGLVAGPNEDVRYSLTSAGAIVRITAGFTDVLVENVPQGGFRLSYFDADGNELVPADPSAGLDAAQLAAVRRVRVKVRLEDEPVDSQNDRVLRAAASMDVTMRNRFFVNAIQGAAC